MVELSPGQKMWKTRKERYGLSGFSEEGMRKLMRPKSEVTKRKLSETMKGRLSSRVGYVHSEVTRKKMSKSHKRNYQDKGWAENHRKNMPRGSNHWQWKGGVSDYWETSEYIAWRTAIFERDDYTCQTCGQIGGDLCSHHIKYPASKYPDLIYDVDNGQTLCVLHHAEKHPKQHGMIMSRVGRKEI